MKTILDFLPLTLLIAFVFLLAYFARESSNEGDKRRHLDNLDKKEHAQFMVENKCIISIIDETLSRKGCIDINNEIHWRE